MNKGEIIKKNFRIIMTILFLICLNAVSMSCSGKTVKKFENNEEDKIELEGKTILSFEIDSTNQLNMKSPQNSSLLFDKSSSMRGYMECSSDPRFYGAISSVVNIAKVDSFYFYGKTEDSGLDKKDFNDILNKRKIAWSSESDIKTMIGSMITHINKGDDICMLVTDGILSGSNSDISNSPNKSYNIIHREELCNNIKDMLEKQKKNGLSALIVRYKAKFKTSKSIQAKGGWYYYCYNNDKRLIDNQDRPFFVIALGKYGYIKWLENELNKTLQQSVSTKYENILLLGDDLSAYGAVKLSYSKGITLDSKDKGLFNVRPEYRRDSMVCLTADISRLPKYMQTTDYMENNVELFVKHGLKNAEKQAKPFDKNYRKISVVESSGKTVLKLYLKASRVLDSEITFKIKYSMPVWIKDRSDNDDTDITTSSAEMDKTFNLEYLINGFKVLQKGDYIKEQKLKFK